MCISPRLASHLAGPRYETLADFYHNLRLFKKTIKSANYSLLLNEDWLTNSISHVGMYSEGSRPSPRNASYQIYGNDAKYQMKVDNVGMWQIPRQLAGYLINVVKLGRVHKFLDIGTCRGATVTVATIYFMQFGLNQTETIDVVDYLPPAMKKEWSNLNLPIRHIIYPQRSSPLNLLQYKQYDTIFIDGHHDYPFVSSDFKMYSNMTTRLGFHDINDFFCVGVRKLWREIIVAKQNCPHTTIREFTYHSHGDSHMGIGLVHQPLCLSINHVPEK